MPQTDESTLRTARPSITYSTHVKNRGWLPNVSSGQLSGTTGQSLQVEAFRINLSSSLSGAIEYTSYVQGSGCTKFWLASLDNERKSFRNTWIRSSNRSN